MIKNITIGGNGYRWRGKSIRTIMKDGSTCVNMPTRDSVILAPVEIYSNVTYKIKILAERNGGGGNIFVNFFGGINYDGKHIPVVINSNKMSEYSVNVKTPKFPKNVPMFLRIWRPSGANGNIIIKSISCTVDDENLQGVIKARGTRPISNNHEPEIIRKPKQKKIKKQSLPKKVVSHVDVKGNDDMKFYPYLSKVSKKEIEDVLITQKSDVPLVSIITPTRDGYGLIKSCYEAIVKNTCYPNWEWIVGDSNSSDGTYEYLSSLNDDRVKVIQRGTTYGSFSSINNELTEHASGEYYLFLNDDTEPQPFWLFEMMSKIYRNDEIGAVGAKLLYAKDKIQHAGIAFINEGPANIGKSVLKSFPANFADYDRFYQAVTAACLLIRKSDFEKVNKFDPIYYFCYEDVDLCLKVHYNLGKKVLYASRAEVIHKESVTQNKHKTHGELQQIGIREFKKRWMNIVVKDFVKYQADVNRNKRKIDISFVTCVNNYDQYRKYVLGSLFKNETKKNFEVVPIVNFGNKYSASQALNIGINSSSGKIIVLCHQDVLFYKNWIDLLYDRIDEIEKNTTNWGIIGTAGISKRDDTIGVVHTMRGKLQWRASKRKTVFPVQTLDEHCLIMRRNCRLRFDENNFDGFHFYGVDLALQAMDAGMTNFGILCPLVHGSGSGSLQSGRDEFMRLLKVLANKWKNTFSFIRTPTSVINKGSIRTFIEFN